MDFGGLINGFGDMLKGIVDIGQGVVKEAEGIGPGIVYFGMDISVLVQFVLVFIYTNFICGLQMLTNLTSCFVYYMLDVLASITYIPISIFVFIISRFGIPGYQLEKQFWDGMEWLDRKIYGKIKFHIIHYPKSVRKKCYNCKRLKIGTFGKIISEFIDDVEDPIFDLLFAGVEQAGEGVMELFQGLMELLGGLMSIL